MGKKDKKKDPAKQFALQARKEAKADKKEQKRRLKKEQKQQEQQNLHIEGGAKVASSLSNINTTDDDDIDALLESYKNKSSQLKTPVIEFLEDDKTIHNGASASIPFPYPPRGNFTLTHCPRSGDIIMFGGEYFNGIDNTVFDELLCWSPDAKPRSVSESNVVSEDEYDSVNVGVLGNEDELKQPPTSTKKPHLKRGVWKRILSPSPKPKPRCSHTTVYYNNALYVFGGELANSDSYHHYRDFWKFDLKTHLWTELKSSPSLKNVPPPSPR